MGFGLSDACLLGMFGKELECVDTIKSNLPVQLHELAQKWFVDSNCGAQIVLGLCFAASDPDSKPLDLQSLQKIYDEIVINEYEPLLRVLVAIVRKHDPHHGERLQEILGIIDSIDISEDSYQDSDILKSIMSEFDIPFFEENLDSFVEDGNL